MYRMLASNSVEVENWHISRNFGFDQIVMVRCPVVMTTAEFRLTVFTDKCYITNLAK